MTNSRRTTGRALLGLIAVCSVTTMTACRSGETALDRGDRFWADSNYTAALAEYRLAASRSGADEDVLARVAHAYALTGQIERAREEYANLLKLAPELADQAVFDYLMLANAAAARSDRFGLARAVEAALEIRPGIEVGRWAPSLARHYASAGDADRALEYFERALAVVSESAAPNLLFEVATLHERQGDCNEAMTYLRSYLARNPYGDSANDARFRIGSCAFELGRRARDQGNLAQALEHFETIIDFGSPANLQDQAWFERGEALLLLGRRVEALEAFRRVIELSPDRNTQTSVRARRRVQELEGKTSTDSRIGMHFAGSEIETGCLPGVYARPVQMRNGDET
jgi:tetratricopeptide (TPR) repeat protein